MSIRQAPTFKVEQALQAQGYRWIVGVDEAGCGALAGPVVAGAAILTIDSGLEKLRDSKLLSEKVREELFDQVKEQSVSWGVGQASVEEIEKIGIRPATYLAMRRAVESIAQVDYALVDAWTVPGLTVPQQGFVKGDRKIRSIAAASILAKVTRDRQMREHAQAFPQYGFDGHKGYGTAAHRQAIKDHGPCAIHRMTYKTFHPTLV